MIDMSRLNVISRPGLRRWHAFGRAIGALTFFITLGVAFAATSALTPQPVCYVGYVKLTSDGVLSAYTAVLEAAYHDRKGWTGDYIIALSR